MQMYFLRVIAAFVLLVGTGHAFAQSLPIGRQDYVDANTSQGWACDLDNATYVYVHFYRSSNGSLTTPWTSAQYIGYTATVQPRPDVAAAGVCGSYAAGYYKGYYFAFPQWAKDGQGYYIYAVATDMDVNASVTGTLKNLDNSPVWTQFPAPQTSCNGGFTSSSIVYGNNGVVRVHATGVQNATSMQFRTYGAPNGANDLMTRAGINSGGGAWYVDVDVSQHAPGNPEYGTIVTDIYAYSASVPSGIYCGQATFLRDRALPMGPAVGLWDPGLTNGKWRTEYNSTATGTMGDALALTGCTTPFGAAVVQAGPSITGSCITQAPWDSYLVNNYRGRPIWSESNASAKGGPGQWAPQGQFWVVTANNERAYGNVNACNPGPPNQSFTVSEGGGIVNVTHSGTAVTLQLDSGHPAAQACRGSNPAPQGGLTFLSFGVDAQRSNGGVVTYLNSVSSPKRLTFTASATQVAKSDVFLFVEASIDGVRRWLYIYLDEASDVFAHAHWNWNIQQSMWWGGADIAYVNQGSLAARCPAYAIGSLPPVGGSPSSYNIDLESIFRCVDDMGVWGGSSQAPKIPRDRAVPITGIHFAIEQPITFGVNHPSFAYTTTLKVQDVRLQ